MMKHAILLTLVFIGFSFHAKAQTELIANGGFETGDGTGWVLNGTEVANNYPHTGVYTLWFGGITDWTDDSYQTVTIPAGVSTATLSFYYNIVSPDSGSTANDTFTATIQDGSGNVLATVGNWSNLDRDQGTGGTFYHKKTFDLFPYRGQTVRIAFNSSNDSTLISSFFLDDVSVVTTVVTGPADLAPQNVSVTPNPALAGSAVTVSYTVANLGASNAPASHTKIVIKDGANNVFSQQVFPTSALAGAASTNESHTMGLVSASAGTYNVFVTVDANSEVAQTNTVNDTSAALPLTVQTSAGLVIIPTFDSTITSDPNAAAITNTINAAIQQYEAQFSDPITVTITFSKMASGLGQSQTYSSVITYSNLLAALNSDAKTTNDAIALAHLPAGPANPVNGNNSVTVTTANLRALGISSSPPAGQTDSYISLNTSIMNLTRASIDPNKYDLMAVAQHEIDEALSLSSTLNGSHNGDPTPATPVHIMDLFRYDQTGARSFNTALATQAYFSIDGTNDLVRFNQTSGYDFQDWYSPGNQTPRVQDAIGTRGAAPGLGVELIALDVSGYNLVSAVPVPKILSEVKTGNTVTLTWTSQAGLSYQLQYKTNVAQVGWVNLGSPTPATGSTTSGSDSISATQHYYRVAVLTPGSSIVSKEATVPTDLHIVTNYFRPY
jgi:hypothetical protein